MIEIFALENLPFAIALGVMCFIALLEIIGMLIGLSASSIVDSLLPDFDGPDIDIPDVDLEVGDITSAGGTMGADLDMGGIESGGFFSKILGWMSFGRLPVLIWLVVFLCSFGLIGLAMQATIHDIAGFYLPAWIAVIPVLILSVPITGNVGGLLAKVMPDDETEAISREEFVGKVATIVRGVASKGAPAEAKLHDRYERTHYVLVTPDIDTETFDAGSRVLIVKRSKNLYSVIKASSEALSD